MKLLTESLFYKVCLISGNITVCESIETKLQPFKIVDGLLLADYYSLNILRQNIREEIFKGMFNVTSNSRNVLGIDILEDPDEIILKMKYITDNFPELFI